MQSKKQSDTPIEIHAAMQEAFAFFNQHLFGAQLPACLITLQRKSRTTGYYSHKRFISNNRHYTDEIALNPEFFGVVPVVDTLSTLVHEMVHMWQQHFGKPPRRCYHNKEWADKMEAIGLMPSDTHKPGGKRTGEHMGDYIMEDGLFIQAATALLRTGFAITWYDVYPPYSPTIGAQFTHTALLNLPDEIKNPPALPVENGMRPAIVWAPEKPLDAAQTGSTAITEPETYSPTNTAALMQHLSGAVLEDSERPQKNKSNRVKYICPSCQSAVWGKPKLNVWCGDCQLPYRGEP